MNETNSLIKQLLDESPDIPQRVYSIGPEIIIAHFGGRRTSYGLAREAVNKYTQPDEIEQFYSEMVELMRQEAHCDSADTARKLTDELIGYCTSYADEEHQKTWFDALPTIKHPVYGRDPTFGIKGEIADYSISVKNADKEKIAAIYAELKEKLDTEPDMFPTFEVYQLEDLTGEYAVFGLKFKHGGMFGELGPRGIVTFLAGFIYMMRLSEDGHLEIELEAREKGTVS